MKTATTGLLHAIGGFSAIEPRFLIGAVPNTCYTVLELACLEWLSMSTENRATALAEGETLSYQRDGERFHLLVGTSAWYAWLQTATSFRVCSPFVVGLVVFRRPCRYFVSMVVCKKYACISS